jgi:hypothetical protein
MKNQYMMHLSVQALLFLHLIYLFGLLLELIYLIIFLKLRLTTIF